MLQHICIITFIVINYSALSNFISDIGLLLQFNFQLLKLAQGNKFTYPLPIFSPACLPTLNSRGRHGEVYTYKVNFNPETKKPTMATYTPFASH